MQASRYVTILMPVFIGGSFAADEPLSVQNLANQISGRRWEDVNRSLLPKGKEQEVIDVLRKERYYAVLFRLNDQPAIDEFIAKYRGKRGLDYRLVQELELCKAPYILDELAPSLYEGPDLERRRTRDGYHGDLGYAMTTAKAMSAIIAAAPELPEAVRKSVNANTGVGPPIMRAWWEANEAALREERYGDVKPVLQVAAERHQMNSENEAPSERVGEVPGSPSASGLSQVKEVSKVAVNQPMPEPRRAGVARLVAIGALAIGAIVAIVVVLRIRRDSPPPAARG